MAIKNSSIILEQCTVLFTTDFFIIKFVFLSFSHLQTVTDDYLLFLYTSVVTPGQVGSTLCPHLLSVLISLYFLCHTHSEVLVVPLHTLHKDKTK